MGDDFVKLYVCLYNKWNPYSKEVEDIPWIYWTLAFNMIQVRFKTDWDHKILPHAEMIGQLTHPEIFTEYKKQKDRIDKRDNLKTGQDYYETTPDGIEGGGIANAHYDPRLGLVDETGKILIPKEKYEQMLGMEGVAISW